MIALQEHTRTLRTKCLDVLTPEEAEVSVRSLEAALKALGKRIHSLSCPEINISKQVAIIRSPILNLNLVNPKIIFHSEKVISYQECCSSFPDSSFNCLRHLKITLENGFDKRTAMEYSGTAAFLIQHEVDHLCGRLVPDRTIRVAIARDFGKIKDMDFCPCASKKRYFQCCCSKEG